MLCPVVQYGNLVCQRTLFINICRGWVKSAKSMCYSSFNRNNVSAATPFGIPLDTLTVSQTDAGWLMFMAATVTDPLVRDSLLQSVWMHLTSNQTASLASKIYNLNSSGTFSGLSRYVYFPLMAARRTYSLKSLMSSPGFGSAFAPMAMKYRRSLFSKILTRPFFSAF